MECGSVSLCGMSLVYGLLSNEGGREGRWIWKSACFLRGWR